MTAGANQKLRATIPIPPNTYLGVELAISSFPYPGSLYRLPNMTEVSFAKSFLSTLNSRPTKFSADHVEDPKSYPSRSPVSPSRPFSSTLPTVLTRQFSLQYTLPRHSKPMSRRSRLAPGAERSVTVTVRSLRGPSIDVKLPAQPLSTSALDVRTAVAEKAGVGPEKVKLLHKKKPVPDSKVLKDLVGDGDTSIEFSVMVMGGGAAAAAAAPAAGSGSEAAAPVSGAGLAGAAVLDTEEFWGDLKGFLQQRLRDEAAAEEALGRFRGAWQERS